MKTYIMDSADDIPESELMQIWRRLTPAQRDYDRLVARSIPRGASWGAETPEGRVIEAERDAMRGDDRDGPGCCSCHISAPCNFCVSQSEEGE